MNRRDRARIEEYLATEGITDIDVEGEWDPSLTFSENLDHFKELSSHSRLREPADIRSERERWDAARKDRIESALVRYRERLSAEDTGPKPTYRLTADSYDEADPATLAVNAWRAISWDRRWRSRIDGGWTILYDDYVLEPSLGPYLERASDRGAQKITLHKMGPLRDVLGSPLRRTRGAESLKEGLRQEQTLDAFKEESQRTLPSETPTNAASVEPSSPSSPGPRRVQRARGKARHT